MTPITQPIALSLAHTPLQREADVARLSLTELALQWHDVTTIPIPSGEDILAILARAIPHDLLLIETTLRGAAYQTRAHPLAGLTVVVEADDLAAHTVEALQQAAGRGRPNTVAELSKAGKQVGQAFTSQRLIRQALQGRYTASEPDPVLEAAALLLPLLRVVETAVAHHHSLILRYERPLPAPSPTWRNLILSQLRPLLLADLFAATYIVAGLITKQVQLDVTLFITYILLLIGFVLPLWAAQTIIWVSAQWQGAITEWRLGQANLERERSRPFLLSLYVQTFILNTLYQPPPHSPKPLPSPAPLYLTFLGLIFLLTLSITPLLSSIPLLIPFLIALGLSSFLFALSHIIAPQ